MAQGNSVPRVSSGVPWWLWMLALVASAAVILGIVSDRSRNDVTSSDIFARAAAALESGDGAIVLESHEALRRRDDADEQVAILDGIKAGATHRFPRSVKLLAPFLGHSNDQYRKLALKYSAVGYQRMGDSKRARQLTEQYAEIDPSDVQPLVVLMQMYMDVGALEAATETAARVLTLDSENRNALTITGLAHVLRGELAEAKKSLAAMLESEGDRAAASPEVVMHYVTALIKLDESEAALKFQRDNSSLLTDPMTRLLLYMETNQLEDFDAVLKTLEMPADSAFHIQARGARAINAGDWELAVGLLSQAALQLPRSTQVFEQLELAATENKQSDLAEACRENLNAVRRLEQQMQEAVRAIGPDMEDPELRLKVAELAIEVGLPTQAQRWIDAATRVAPSDQAEILKLREQVYRRNKLLVPIGAAFSAVRKSETVAPQPTDSDSSNENPASDDGAPSATSAEEAGTGDSPVSEESSAEPESADRPQANDESAASKNLEKLPK